MNKQRIIFSVFLFFVACPGTYAQNSISISNMFPQYMNLDPNNYAPSAQEMTFQYSEWINYMTLIDYYGEPDFSITVQLVSAHRPKGLDLKIEAGPYRGYSTGAVGIPTGMKTVSQGARVLIDNISTCYTGSGRGQGHRAILFFSVPNNREEDTTSYKINVVYTLMQ